MEVPHVQRLARKKSWGRAEGVSPVIATILLVGITVVLAATLYIMAFGLGGGDAGVVTPYATVTTSTSGNGFRFTFTQFSKETTWSEISILLSDGTNMVAFDNVTAEHMSGGEPVTKSLGSRNLGGLTVFMNASDLTGNGRLNAGDGFTLTTGGATFENDVSYEVSIVYKPSGSMITSKVFQGA